MNLWAYLLQRPLVEFLGPAARRLARQSYQHDLSVALGAAGAFHLAVMICALWLGMLANGPPDTVTRILDPPPYVLGREPKSGEQEPNAPTYRPPRPSPPKPPVDGIPVVAPIKEVPDTTTTPTSSEPVPIDFLPGDDSPTGDSGNGPGGQGGDGNGRGGGGEDGGGYPPMDTLVVVEVEPVRVEQPLPVYPEFAKMAQIEGSVIVRVLVGKDGRVKNAVLIQGTNPMLDEAALDAAARAIFKPALQQGHPVPVWVNLPFRFSLKADDRLR